MTFPLPPDESERLEQLRAYGILDTDPELAFDDLAKLAAAICGTPIALVSLVDRDRQWFKASVGTEAQETLREHAFCSYTICGGDVFEVPDASEDARFATNPYVTGDPRIRFYAGAPLETETGARMGSLCVIDRAPRRLDASQRVLLASLARQVVAQLELRMKLTEARERERVIAEQRDALARLEHERREVTELVVHDLRNPLAVVLCNAEILHATPGLGEDAQASVDDIREAGSRIGRMVADVLDVSRGETAPLMPRFADVEVGPFMREIGAAVASRARMNGREVLTDVARNDLVARADRELLRRILENLIDNAFKYSPNGSHVTLEARPRANGLVELVVRDLGDAIPEAKRLAIFDKYARLAAHASVKHEASYGLGLSFCRLAVNAQGGELGVEPNEPRGNAFWVRLPAATGAPGNEPRRLGHRVARKPTGQRYPRVRGTAGHTIARGSPRSYQSGSPTASTTT